MNAEELKPALPTSMNFNLTDQEKQEAFINQEGYQDMLEQFLKAEYRPSQDMMGNHSIINA